MSPCVRLWALCAFKYFINLMTMKTASFQVNIADMFPPFGVGEHITSFADCGASCAFWRGCCHPVQLPIVTGASHEVLSPALSSHFFGTPITFRTSSPKWLMTLTAMRWLAGARNGTQWRNSS